MCGRTCCTLSPDLIPLACSAVTDALPKWRDSPDGGQYFPSTNIPPSRYTPVLCRGDEVGSKSEFVVQPMMWGLVPFWFRGEDPKSTGLTTNNARLEGLKETKLYKPAVEKNQRCVIVCDGFYEWKADAKKGTGKQPYLIYAPQPKGLKIEDMAECSKEDYSKEDGWKGPRLTFMAGLYSVWHKGGDEEKPVFSYTVITRESNQIFSWLHNRVPAILPDKKSVMKWLDPDVEGFKALDVLKPIKKSEIMWHPVSRDVGNTKNHGADLAKPIELDKAGVPIDKKSGSADVMKSWLKSANKKDEKPAKKQKTVGEDDDDDDDDDDDEESKKKKQKKK